MFIGMQLPIHQSRVKRLEEDKKECLAKGRTKNAAVEILSRIPPTPIEKLTNIELETLILYHEIPKKDMGKKENGLNMWRRIVASMKPLPLFDPWTEDNKNELSELKNKEICIGDTALGRLQSLKKESLKATLSHFRNKRGMTTSQSFL